MQINGKQIISLLKKIIKDESVFNLENDYYWDISSSDLYHVKTKPEITEIGQLTDDWNDLQDVLNDVREPVLNHDLIHLSNILKGIANEKDL